MRSDQDVVRSRFMGPDSELGCWRLLGCRVRNASQARGETAMLVGRTKIREAFLDVQASTLVRRCLTQRHATHSLAAKMVSAQYVVHSRQ